MGPIGGRHWEQVEVRRILGRREAVRGANQLTSLYQGRKLIVIATLLDRTTTIWASNP
jgi:hypothetical protein